MPLEFTYADELAVTSGIKVALYGRSGVGKTRGVLTCPKPLFISAESGALSLKNACDREGNRIPAVKIRNITDLEEIISVLYTQQTPFETIYIDSATEIGEVILANAKELSSDPRKAYGVLIDRMTETLKMFRDLPGKHVVITFKQESHQDEVSKVTTYGPAMPGSKMGPAIPYLFDEVFRLGVAKTQQNVEYSFIQTRPDLQYDAKDRSGVLDPIEPPDLGLIFQKILARKP